MQVRLFILRTGQGEKVHPKSSSRTLPSAGLRQPRGGIPVCIRQWVPWHNQRLKDGKIKLKSAPCWMTFCTEYARFLHHQSFGEALTPFFSGRALVDTGQQSRASVLTSPVRKQFGENITCLTRHWRQAKYMVTGQSSRTEGQGTPGNMMFITFKESHQKSWEVLV